jgi:hypothetical protein
MLFFLIKKRRYAICCIETPGRRIGSWYETAFLHCMSRVRNIIPVCITEREKQTLALCQPMQVGCLFISIVVKVGTWRASRAWSGMMASNSRNGVRIQFETALAPSMSTLYTICQISSWRWADGVQFYFLFNVHISDLWLDNLQHCDHLDTAL